MYCSRRNLSKWCQHKIPLVQKRVGDGQLLARQHEVIVQQNININEALAPFAQPLPAHVLLDSENDL